MTRLVGNDINSLVQVVDSNGDKVTDAVVNYKVYFYDYDDDEVWEVAQSGLMTHIGDGLYQAEWTPNFYGEYVFYAYSSNPKFHESYTYFIEDLFSGVKSVASGTYTLPDDTGHHAIVGVRPNPSDGETFWSKLTIWVDLYEIYSSSNNPTFTLRVQSETSAGLHTINEIPMHIESQDNYYIPIDIPSNTCYFQVTIQCDASPGEQRYLYFKVIAEGCEVQIFNGGD
jgi:hypothetical protein